MSLEDSFLFTAFLVQLVVTKMSSSVKLCHGP